MTTATCVKANNLFTLFNEYEFILGEGRAYIVSDTGQLWTFYDEGDGYYGCTDINGKHVSFLVYE